MTRSGTIGAIVVSAVLCGWAVPLDRLFDAFQPMIVALLIMLAAILVRLNRGMPALDWKSLEQTERTRLTSNIVDLVKEYGIIAAIDAILLIFLVALTIVGKDEAVKDLGSTIGRGISATIGAMAALSAARMIYVIWRDYDIVRLQKKLIDASGDRERIEVETKIATNKVSDIRAASLRKVGSADPKPWTVDE